MINCKPQKDQFHLLNYYWFKIMENRESQNYAFINKIKYVLLICVKIIKYASF